MARRITSRSKTSASSAGAASTATRSAASSGSPSARCTAHATNVETISISPCAKFSVRVAL
jgi:hypothetical protein